MNSMLPNCPFRSLMIHPAMAAMHMAILIFLMPALAPIAIAAEKTAPPLRASGIGENPGISRQAQQLADWVAMTGDHTGAPFIIVDKKRASVLVFEPDARLRANSAVLLGLARGDASVPGIGTRPMAQILPAERTTPAGRFVAELGRNMQGEDVVWVDYDAAVSMHRVRTANPVEQRAKRLASPTIDDNRISYGCINVPGAFYDKFIQPIFAQRKAIVYVLPEIKSVNEVFGLSQPAPSESAANKSVSAYVQAGIGVRR